MSAMIPNNGFIFLEDENWNNVNEGETYEIWIRPIRKRCTPHQNGRFEKNYLNEQIFDTWIPAAPVETKAALSRLSKEQLKFYWNHRKLIQRERVE